MENTNFGTVSGLCLSLDRESVPRTVVYTRCGDNMAHKLDIVLFSGGERVNVPQDAAVTMFSQRSDGTSLWSPCTVNGDGTVTHTFTSGELSVPGKLECELHIVSGESEMTSPKFRITVDNIIRNDSEVEASDDYSALGEIIQSTRELIPETEELLCGDGNGGIIPSGLSLGEFNQSVGLRNLVTHINGEIEANTYKLSTFVPENPLETLIPTTKSVKEYVDSTRKEYVTSGIPGTATAGNVGDILLHSSSGMFYKCTSAEDGVYKWEQVIMPDAFVIPYSEGVSRTWYFNEIREQMKMMHLLYNRVDVHDNYTQVGFLKNGNILNTPFRVYGAFFYTNSDGGNVRTVIYPAFYYEGTGYYSRELSSQRYRAVGFITPGTDDDAYITVRTVKCWQITRETSPSVLEDYPIEMSSSGTVIPMDNIPTEESQHAISSDGVRSALDDMQTKTVSDEGGYYNSGTVEGILQEIGAALSGADDALDVILETVGGDE